VPRAYAPGQQFRVWAEVEDRGFWGLFLGTYSTSRTMPHAAGCGACGRYAAASLRWVPLWSACMVQP
jgi:hypothetical protein